MSALRELRFFHPQATRKRVVKAVHRLDDDPREYADVRPSALMKKEEFLHSEMYLTTYSKKYMESHKHLYRCKQLLFGKWTIHKLQIPYYQLIVIILTMHMSIERLMRIQSMYILSFRISAFITYTVTSLLISMLLFSYFMFMGYYSKKCSIRYWQTTPLFKGVAFTIILTVIMEASKEIQTCATAVLYLFKVFKNGIEWQSCKWSNTLNEECVSKNEKFQTDLAKGICPKSLTVLPTYLYYERIIRDKFKLMLYMFAISIVLFICLMLFKKIKMVLCVINTCIIALVLGPLFLSTHYYLLGAHSDYTPIRKIDPPQQLKIFLRFFKELIWQALPSAHLTYTAKLKNSVQFTSFLDSNLIFMLIFLSDIIIQAWLAVSMHSFLKMHKIENCQFEKVGELVGNKLFFMMHLDVLMHESHSNQIVIIIYLLVIVYWSLVGVLCSIYAIVETISDAYMHLMKYKLAYYLGTTVGVFATAMTRCFRLFSLENSYMFLHLKYLVILLVTINMALYSTKRFSKDYHFTFGRSINRNCLIIYKLIQIICLAVVITNILVMLRELVKEEDNLASLLKRNLLFLIGIGICISFAGWASKQHGKSETICSPEPSWGPAHPNLKALRRKFGQDKDANRRTFDCKHHCLINSAALHRETELWVKQAKYLEKRLI